MPTYESAMYESDMGYDPSIDAPTTLEEVIEFSVWRDDQLTWAEETVANLVYLELDLRGESGPIFDRIMAGEGFVLAYNPFHGSVRS